MEKSMKKYEKRTEKEGNGPVPSMKNYEKGP
jgi:hypothetical protein